jgi:geranylgeranyl pyrophosphate synthase
MCQTAHGQQLDVQNPQDEAGYWHVVATKSTPFFSTALYIGALCGGAERTHAAAIQEVGRFYGTMIQIHDDLNDTMAIPAGPDWLQNRSPLPILFAQTVPHPDRETFIQLRQQATDPEALRAAQEILLRCGAVSYAVDQIWQCYQQAHRLVMALEVPRAEKLEGMLLRLMEPIQKLLQTAGGVPFPIVTNLPDQARLADRDRVEAVL